MASNMSYSEEGEDDQEENGETSIAAVPSAGLAAPCSTPVRQPSMSFIHKLMIQGIRGFGTGNDQKVIIEFGKPLTLITGQNGAGKTTIIECLKYATTGDLPPNSKGGAFVHDPKLVNEREVRGLVKLKFQNTSGEAVVCHRMLQSTQKMNKIEQKTLDSSLEKIDLTGKKVKLTTRCAEIDREMINLLGVSKPILSHVIFCHQEDSSWPLSEGKVLKTKFDEIFASTRYTRALESFKKIQLELSSEIKIYKTELHHLQKQKQKGDEVKNNLQETQSKVENSKAEITRIHNELTPMEFRLQDLTDKYDEVTKMEKDITMYESSKKELVKNQQQLESKIEVAFSGRKSELQLRIEQHSSELERSTVELEGLKKRQGQLMRGVDDMKGRVSDCHKEHGRLKTEEKYHKERIISRDKKMVSLAAQHSLVGHKKGPFEQRNVTEFLSKMATLKAEREEKSRAENTKLVEKEQEVQQELDQLRTNLAKIEESVEMKNKTARESRLHMVEITKQLANIGSGAAALEGVEQELSDAVRDLEEYREHVDLTTMEKELEQSGHEKQGTDKRVLLLQKELSQLSLQASARGALEELRKQKRVKEERYQLQLESVEPELLSVFGLMPSEGEDVGRRMKELVRSKEQEHQSSSDCHRREAAQLSRLQAQQEELEKQIVNKKQRMQLLQQEVNEVCGGDDNESSYQEMLDSLRAQIDSVSENIATVKGSQSFFRKSLEKLHSNNKCPLCMRNFDEQASLDSTIKLITTRLNNAIPRMIPRLNSELHQLQERQGKVQQLRPKIEELSNIRSHELSQRKEAMKEKEKAVAGMQVAINKQREKQEHLRQELEHIRSLQPKVLEVSQLKEQLVSLDKSISVEERKLDAVVGGSMSSLQRSQRSHHLVNRELQEAQRAVEELNRKMDCRRKEMAETQRMLHQLEERVHWLREEKLRLQSQLQQRETLISKKDDLNCQVKALEREAKAESNRIAPVKEKMEELEVQRDKVRREKGETSARNWAELESFRNTLTDLKNTSDIITRYLREGKDEAMERCEEKMQSLTAQMETKTAERKELEGKMFVLNKQLANAKNQERDLTDNLLLMENKEEIVKRTRKVEELKERLRGMGLESYDQEFQQLQTDVNRLRKEQARVEGHKLGQEDQVRHLQRELHSELYAGIEERYMDMLIKLKTSELASSDLKKYHRALDRAIMRFHRCKMDYINQIIKELWIKTYKGGDIDTIRVCSDDTTQSDVATATIIARRVYNYRVVMVKGNLELDMRGRCSAGQKVLASIIIRLALAETFCLTSGLLALDEPTANLDRDNVDGLASSLIDIIKERSKNQKNFQLLIITHDEEFVQLLGQNGFTDVFYKVTKNVGETSQVKKYYF